MSLATPVGPENLTYPQSLQVRAELPNGVKTFATRFSGILTIKYGTGGGPFSSQEFVHPVCAIGPLLAGRTRIPKDAPSTTYLPVLGAADGFHGASASVALENIWMKPGDGVTSILTTRADLWLMTLEPSGEDARAVLLSFTVQGKNSEIYTVNYSVEVLAHGYQPRPITDDNTVPGAWNGRFSLNGKANAIVSPGQPQR